MASAWVFKDQVELPPLLILSVQETRPPLLQQVNDMRMARKLLQNSDLIHNVFFPLGHILIGYNFKRKHLRVVMCQPDHKHLGCHALPNNFDELILAPLKEWVPLNIFQILFLRLLLKNLCILDWWIKDVGCIILIIMLGLFGLFQFLRGLSICIILHCHT